MHPLQEKWLEEHVFKDGLERMRPSEAWKAMKAFFSGKIREETMTPMWLEKEQISKWLAGKKAEEKTRRKALCLQLKAQAAKNKTTSTSASSSLAAAQVPPVSHSTPGTSQHSKPPVAGAKSIEVDREAGDSESEGNSEEDLSDEDDDLTM
jgi:hypothetical protein